MEESVASPDGFYFDPVEHKYYKNGIEYISVSRYRDSKFKKFDPEKRSKRKADDIVNTQIALSEEVEEQKEEKTSKGELQERKKVKASHLKEVWKKAQEKGIEAHDSIDRFLKGLDYENNHVIDQIKEFMEEQELEPFQSEIRVHDDEMRMAGTIDAIFKHKEGYYVLVDWKRVKKLYYRGTTKYSKEPFKGVMDCNYNKYSIQLTLYKYMAEKQLGIEIKKCYIFVIAKQQEQWFVYDINYFDINAIVEHRKKELLEESKIDNK